jgi:hypothetical protein
MTIKGFFGLNRRDRFGDFQTAANPADTQRLGEIRREMRRALEENLNNQIQEAHERVREQQREKRKQRPRKTGSERLSNTDTMRRARQVRARLVAKLSEVYGTDMELRARDASAMDIKMQINRVDQQITSIRRRERAIEEEKTVRRKDDTPEARRRRARDMQEQRIYIRRDYLYHADKGGFDPKAVFDFGGNVGTMEIAADAGFGGADFNMEVVL